MRATLTYTTIALILGAYLCRGAILAEYVEHVPAWWLANAFWPLGWMMAAVICLFALLAAGTAVDWGDR